MTDFIHIYEEAISKKTCEYFIDFFEQEDKLGNTFSGHVSAGTVKSIKDTTDLHLRKGSFDISKQYLKDVYESSKHLKYVNIYDSIVKKKFEEYIKKYHFKDERFSHLLSTGESLFNPHPNLNLDAPLMHRYKPPNQGYHAWHYDWGLTEDNFRPDRDNENNFKNQCPICDWTTVNQLLSMRMMVGLVYLNDVDEGGETEFFHQKVKIKPKQGTLLVWPAHFTHIHRGNKPISNTKYVINQWFIPKLL